MSAIGLEPIPTICSNAVAGSQGASLVRAGEHAGRFTKTDAENSAHQPDKVLKAALPGQSREAKLTHEPPGKTFSRDA